MVKNPTKTNIIENSDLEAKMTSSNSKSGKTTEEISENFSNPEKEFMKKCDDKIKQIDKEKREVNKEGLKRLKMIPQMDDHFAKELCLNTLSNVLSEDELSMVKS